jgi:hypothetical protein
VNYVCYVSITITFLAPDLPTEQINHRGLIPCGLLRSKPLTTPEPLVAYCAAPFPRRRWRSSSSGSRAPHRRRIPASGGTYPSRTIGRSRRDSGRRRPTELREGTPSRPGLSVRSSAAPHTPGCPPRRIAPPPGRHGLVVRVHGRGVVPDLRHVVHSASAPQPSRVRRQRRLGYLTSHAGWRPCRLRSRTCGGGGACGSQLVRDARWRRRAWRLVGSHRRCPARSSAPRQRPVGLRLRRAVVAPGW